MPRTTVSTTVASVTGDIDKDSTTVFDITTNNIDETISTENTDVTSDVLMTTYMDDLTTKTYETASFEILDTFETPERDLKLI